LKDIDIQLMLPGKIGAARKLSMLVDTMKAKHIQEISIGHEPPTCISSSITVSRTQSVKDEDVECVNSCGSCGIAHRVSE